ncbi:hypothetical protein F2P81_025553 [Scophthalmus maximus]|uniref:Uncharacterized protein n=1 Tax=Scophthalmus maximus TaxID=52904 RepID=A0A6A4RT60_SCOMX|nr:hypothetical protein F2P81_025553 [Scophthalmus maximus]
MLSRESFVWSSSENRRMSSLRSEMSLFAFLSSSLSSQVKAERAMSSNGEQHYELNGRIDACTHCSIDVPVQLGREYTEEEGEAQRHRRVFCSRKPQTPGRKHGHVTSDVGRSGPGPGS